MRALRTESTSSAVTCMALDGPAFQQVRRLASWCGAGIQHAQGLREIQPLQQQWRGQLRRSILHRNHPLGKSRQLGHRQGLLQDQAVLTHRR
jgi:hypothetical protein